MKSSCSKMIDYFILRNIIDESQKEIYVYGLKMLFYKIVYACILIAMCFLLKRNFFELVLYYGCYMSIRKYSGGYHAKSIQMCMFLFGLTYLFLDVFVSIQLHIPVGLCVLFASVMIYIIYTNSPIDCENKRLSEEYKVKVKKITGYILLGWFLTMVILTILHYHKQALIILYCFFMIALFMIIS